MNTSIKDLTKKIIADKRGFAKAGALIPGTPDGDTTGKKPITTFELTEEQQKSIERGDEIPDIPSMDDSHLRPSPRPVLIGEGDLSKCKVGQEVKHEDKIYTIVDAIKGRNKLYETEFNLFLPLIATIS